MTLGEKITQLRKKQNLTAEKLSKNLQITRQTLFNWENDITNPDINQAKQIASYFNISLDDLTNNQLKINCNKKNILTNLIGKKCYIAVETDDYNELYDTLCTIIETNQDWMKISYKEKKQTVEKLIDIDLISAIKIIEEEQN